MYWQTEWNVGKIYRQMTLPLPSHKNRIPQIPIFVRIHIHKIVSVHHKTFSNNMQSQHSVHHRWYDERQRNWFFLRWWIRHQTQSHFTHRSFHVCCRYWQRSFDARGDRSQWNVNAMHAVRCWSASCNWSYNLTENQIEDTKSKWDENEIHLLSAWL